MAFVLVADFHNDSSQVSAILAGISSFTPTRDQNWSRLRQWLSGVWQADFLDVAIVDSDVRLHFQQSNIEVESFPIEVRMIDDVHHFVDLAAFIVLG